MNVHDIVATLWIKKEDGGWIIRYLSEEDEKQIREEYRDAVKEG